MKAIINGKRYNTETATEVWSNSSSYPVNDFKYYEETLYKTTAGNWFLQGEGGALSQYAVPVGNSTGGGSRIIPLTAVEAQEWLERIGAVAALEEHFGAKIQDA